MNNILIIQNDNLSLTKKFALLPISVVDEKMLPVKTLWLKPYWELTYTSPLSKKTLGLFEEESHARFAKDLTPNKNDILWIPKGPYHLKT